MPPPPLPAALDPTAVLITSEREKLPPDVAALLDPAAPLPVGVTFFEKRITGGQVAGALAWAGGFAVFGPLCTLFGLYAVIHPVGPVTVYSQVSWAPLGFGLVCCLAAWMMATTARDRTRLRARQLVGQPTRVGLFLTPDALIEAGESSTCVVPRPHVRGVVGQTVGYVIDGREKTLHLPSACVNADAGQQAAAVAAWAGQG